MPDYRYYVINKDGHIIGPPTVLDLPDGDTAVQAAKKPEFLIDGLSVDIWQRARFVAHIYPTGPLMLYAPV